MDSQSSAGTGRSRGRARGRAQAPPSTSTAVESMQVLRISPVPGSGGSEGSNGSNGNGSNGNGNGNGSNGNGGPAVRGRGGYRGKEELDTRPEGMTDFKGTAGQEVTLYSNYVKLKTPTNAVVQSFHVDFEPNIEATQLRRRMLYSIANLFDRPFIFDGMHDIKTLADMPSNDTFTVPNPATQENITIKIRHTGEIPWGSLEMIRMYNTQMRKNLHHIGFVLMGRNYFDRNSRQRIEGQNIELWPGVITAIAQHEAGIMMVVDSSCKFVRAETVLQAMSQIRNRGGDWMESVRKEICGMIVMTTYNSRTYKVDDLDFEKNPQNTTFERNGRQISLIDYYKESHNVTIQTPTQPLISCLPSARDRRAGRTEPILLVPELCALTGLTEQMRSDFHLMRKIGDVSRLAPKDRNYNLNKFMKSIVSNDNVKKEMADWGLGFEPGLVQVIARQLMCEKIYMGQDNDSSAQFFNQKAGDFSKEIRSKRLWNTCSITNWVIICSQRDRAIIEEFANTLKRVCQPMGIILSRPQQEVLSDDRTGTFVGACQRLRPPNEMVVLVVPNNNKDRYDAIKKICYCENPMNSQVVVSRTLAKKQMLMSVCTKIAIQMACKMGGEPWALKIPPKDIMVVGYDTYHDSSQRGRSVGGFVCSMNSTLTSWYSRVAYHTNQEEMSQNFGTNLTEGLRKYFERNNALPTRVLVYRDGVGDGMIPHVFDYELKQCLKALQSIHKDNPPQLTFTIVTKRVNARFFSKPDGRVYDNPIPGTLVDSTVTRDKRYDFYLISQSVRQGTVTPTMYNIIYDKSGFKATHHQQLAYKLTHLYYNWIGTIRVPAPCQYAHKLAFLTGTSLHREPSPHLCDRLFYL